MIESVDLTVGAFLFHLGSGVTWCELGAWFLSLILPLICLPTECSCSVDSACSGFITIDATGSFTTPSVGRLRSIASAVIIFTRKRRGLTWPNAHAATIVILA
jgi:hypothetical protein